MKNLRWRLTNVCSLTFFILALSSTISAQQTTLSQAQDEFRAFHEPVTAKGDSAIVHPMVLNVFFANTISDFLMNESDLPLSSAFAILDNSNNSLSIGGTYLKEGKEERIHWAFSGALRANVKDGFAQLLNSEGELSNNIGVSLKATYLLNGTLKTPYEGKIRAEMDAERKRISIKLYRELQDELKIIDKLEDDNDKEKAKARIRKAYNLKFAEAEATSLLKNRNYGMARVSWISVEAFLPIAKSTYKFANTPQEIEPLNFDYRPFSLKFSYDLLCTRPFGELKARIYLGAIQNNSVLVEQNKKVNYGQYLQQGQPGNDTIYLAQFEDEQVYLGDFERFNTMTTGVEAYYLVKGIIGISAKVERYFGENDFSGTNWKLGIPVSLKGRDKDTKINFELQWTELFGTHRVGLSIGLPIGSLKY
jgi:hypothetical protein